MDCATITIVEDFYQNDKVSCQMIDKKDFVSIKKVGKCMHVQKYLILSTLREYYELSKESYSNKKIGISKFCEHCLNIVFFLGLCVWRGGVLGHQNDKLMLFLELTYSDPAK